LKSLIKRPGVGEAERAVPKPVAAEDVQMDKEHDADSLDKEMAANKMTITSWRNQKKIIY
jgi:hypothetical protein